MRKLSLALLGAGFAVARHVRGKYRVVVVVGESMAPTIRDGERLLARRQDSFKVGDIVVFSVSDDDYGGWRLKGPKMRVKRVVAVGDDPAPSWLPESLRSAGEGRVPAGSVVVAGDAPKSEGSATLGFIDERRILGVVLRSLRQTPVSDAAGQLVGRSAFADD